MSTHAVRIGITAHLEMAGTGDDAHLHYVVSAPYVKAVRKVGALAVSLPVVEPDDAPALLEMVDALVITGGCDVDPAEYGQPPDPLLGRTDPQRDAADLAITRAAVVANMPTLATCRGIQVLNVARGGTLIQHIPEEVGTSVEHRIKEPRFAIAHDVWLTSDSLLERTMRERLEEADACAVGQVGSGPSS